MTKADKVRLLLLSMDSHLPDPRPPRVYAGAEPGPQASYYILCSTCKGCGRLVGADEPCVTCLSAQKDGRTIRRGHGCRLCLACDGQGERRAAYGERNYDSYSGKTMQELAELPTVEPPRKATGATLRAQNPGERDFAWVEERRRLEAFGSYAELRRELEWLRDRHLPRFEMLSHWVSSRDDKFWSWSSQALASVNSTIDMLAERMPDPVKYPGWLRKELAA